MFTLRRSLVAAALTALLPWNTSQADCCAGGHVQFLVNGSQFGYGGGVARGRTAQPFVGLANPRYASTLSIGGPMAGAGPSHQFARRSFVNTPQLEAVAAAAQRQLPYDSDAMLMEPAEAEPPPSEESPADFTPQYPGQAYGQSGARSNMDVDPRTVAGPSAARPPVRFADRAASANSNDLRATRRGVREPTAARDRPLEYSPANRHRELPGVCRSRARFLTRTGLRQQISADRIAAPGPILPAPLVWNLGRRYTSGLAKFCDSDVEELIDGKKERRENARKRSKSCFSCARKPATTTTPFDARWVGRS